MACALSESPSTRVLRVELTCAVCLELYLDPQQLPCGHSFCLRCVQRLIRPQRPLFHCPECRVSCSSTQQLHRNFKLANIADHYRNRRQGQGASTSTLGGPPSSRSEPLPTGTPVTVLCDYCPPAAAEAPPPRPRPAVWLPGPWSPVTVTAKPAAKMCLKCEVMMCREHLRPHLELPAFRDHPLTDPTEFADFRKRKCRDHDEIYSYYCMDEKSFVCNACIVEGGHKGHTVKTLRNTTKDLKGALDHQLKTAEKKSTITELKMQVENEKDRRNKNFVKVAENYMRRLRAEMHVKVDGFVDKLLGLTHDHCDLNAEEIHRNIRKIRRDKVRLQRVHGDIQGLMSENPFRFIEAYKEKEEQLQQKLQQRLFKPECVEGFMTTGGLGEQMEGEMKAFLDMELQSIILADILTLCNFPEEEMEVETLEVIREEDEDASSQEDESGEVEEEEVYEAYDGEEEDEGTSGEMGAREDQVEEGRSSEEDEDEVGEEEEEEEEEDYEAYDGEEEDGGRISEEEEVGAREDQAEEEEWTSSEDEEVVMEEEEGTSSEDEEVVVEEGERTSSEEEEVVMEEEEGTSSEEEEEVGVEENEEVLEVGEELGTSCEEEEIGEEEEEEDQSESDNPDYGEEEDDDAEEEEEPTTDSELPGVNPALIRRGPRQSSIPPSSWVLPSRTSSFLGQDQSESDNPDYGEEEDDDAEEEEELTTDSELPGVNPALIRRGPRSSWVLPSRTSSFLGQDMSSS